MGYKRQNSVRIQLKVALHRLCHDGSLTSYNALARNMGITEGTAMLYTRRCIDALCRRIEDYVYWPNQNQRTIIKKFFEQTKKFPNVLGAIDGTLIPLIRVPKLDRHSWFARHGAVAMGATGVCDHTGAFIFFSTGYPGSVHDSAAYKETELFSHTRKYFSGQEYIVGDVAYGLSKTLISGFKGDIDFDQEEFNTLLGALQCKIEHAFGLLKGRFKSLTNLRSRIYTEEDLVLVTMHISACVVLHNILIRSGIDDPNMLQVTKEGLDHIEEIERFRIRELQAGSAGAAQARALRAEAVIKRQEIMDILLRRHRE